MCFDATFSTIGQKTKICNYRFDVAHVNMQAHLLLFQSHAQLCHKYSVVMYLCMCDDQCARKFTLSTELIYIIHLTICTHLTAVQNIVTVGQ